MQDALKAATTVLQLQPNDVLVLTDADEIPTAAGILQGARYLWNGIKPENASIPEIQFGYASYIFSLYHLRLLMELVKTIVVWYL